MQNIYNFLYKLGLLMITMFNQLIKFCKYFEIRDKHNMQLRFRKSESI